MRRHGAVPARVHLRRGWDNHDCWAVERVCVQCAVVDLQDVMWMWTMIVVSLVLDELRLVAWVSDGARYPRVADAIVVLGHSR